MDSGNPHRELSDTKISSSDLNTISDFSFSQQSNSSSTTITTTDGKELYFGSKSSDDSMIIGDLEEEINDQNGKEGIITTSHETIKRKLETLEEEVLVPLQQPKKRSRSAATLRLSSSIDSSQLPGHDQPTRQVTHQYGLRPAASLILPNPREILPQKKSTITQSKSLTHIESLGNPRPITESEQRKIIKLANVFGDVVSDALGLNLQYAKYPEGVQELAYPEPKHRYVVGKGIKVEFEREEVERFGISEAFACGSSHFPPVKRSSKSRVKDIEEGRSGSGAVDGEAIRGGNEQKEKNLISDVCEMEQGDGEEMDETTDEVGTPKPKEELI